MDLETKLLKKIRWVGMVAGVGIWESKMEVQSQGRFNTPKK